MSDAAASSAARVKACGNGVVPQQADLAFSILLGPAAPFLEQKP